jgi:hypothetical protein
MANEMQESEDREAIARLDHSLRILRYMVDLSGAVIRAGAASDTAKAAAEVIPGAANIGYAIRELLNQRLLSPSEVLLRAFLDRVGTISYFRTKGTEALEIWKNGWAFGKRPSFLEKLDYLPDEIYAHSTSVDPKKRFSTSQLKQEIKNLEKSMHSAVHGGPDSIDKTFIDRHGEFDIHVIGPDTKNTAYFGTLCNLAVASIMLLVFEIQSVFRL